MIYLIGGLLLCAGLYYFIRYCRNALVLTRLIKGHMALHEAGHAVVCEHFNVRVIQVGISLNKGGYGMCVHLATEDQKVDSLIMLGGHVATLLFSEPNVPSNLLEWNDNDPVSDKARFDTRPNKDLTLEQGLAEVTDILTSNKDRLFKIRDTLKHHGRFIP